MNDDNLNYTYTTTGRRITTRHSTGTYEDSLSGTTPTRKSIGRSRARSTTQKKGVAKEKPSKANALRLKRRRELIEEGLPVQKWVRVKRQPTGAGRGLECWVWVPYSQVLTEEIEQKKIQSGTLIDNSYQKAKEEQGEKELLDGELPGKRIKLDNRNDEDLERSGPPIPFQLPDEDGKVLQNQNQNHIEATIDQITPMSVDHVADVSTATGDNVTPIPTASIGKHF